MRNFSLEDTIVAIATPVGASGIGIIRISGKDALSIADRVFLSPSGAKPSSYKTHTVHYGWIVQRHASYLMPHASGGNDAQRRTQDAGPNIIDEVILTVMRSPRSYTREDVVEINCHGGLVAMRAVLDLVLEKGARLAGPGEFTKRAFLKGRIDLSQAEAVLDIIRAKTDLSLKIGVSQLKGLLSKEINKIGGRVLEILCNIEAAIDFPGEDSTGLNPQEIAKSLKNVYRQLTIILEGSARSRVLREGLHMVICGKPNVGKSSLLNALLKKERSIVTHIAGTTRDAVEEIIDIRGIPIRIVDTAGILEPRDLIEKKAVSRSKENIQAADLVLLLFDGNRKLDRDDELLIRKTKNKQVIGIINKIDLKQKIKKSILIKKFNYLIEISAKKSENINLLEDKIYDLVFKGMVIPEDSLMVTNLRHLNCIKKAQKLIAQARDSLDNRLPLEFIALDIKEALGDLNDILGKKISEDLLDKIFSEFCIGK